MKVALIGPELEENLALRYIHASVVHAGQRDWPPLAAFEARKRPAPL